MQLLRQFFYTYGSLLAMIIFIASLMFMLYGCADAVESQETKTPDYVECWSGGVIVYKAQISETFGGINRNSFWVTEATTGKERRLPMAQCYIYEGGK